MSRNDRRKATDNNIDESVIAAPIFESYVDCSMRTMQMLVSILVDSDALKNKPAQVLDH